MNSTRTTMGCIIALSMVAAGLANARPALAGQGENGPTGTAQLAADNAKAGGGATTQAPAADPKAGTSKPGAESPKLGVRVQSRIVKIDRLRKMMDEKVELTSVQKTKIDRLFGDFIEDTKNNVPSRRGDQIKPDNKIFPPEIPQLQRQLEKAQEAGDTAVVERIKADIALLKKEPLTPLDDHSDVLIEKVRAQLNPDQVPAFEKVVERWKAISPRGPRTGPFQQLRRALHDPEAGLSESEMADADKILQDTLKSVQSDPDRSPEKMEVAVAKARYAIYDKLAPAQRSKIEADLKMFKEQEQNLDDSKSRGPNRVDKPKTKDAKQTPKPGSSDKKDPAKPDNDNKDKDDE